MFREGTIKTYNEERGFGFIQIEGESKDLFFHIKDLPNKNIPPNIGEKLKFLIGEDHGKFKAEHIVRLDLKVEVFSGQQHDQSEKTETKASPRYEKTKSSAVSKIITLSGVIVIVILLGLVYNKYQSYQFQKQQKLEVLMLEQQRLVTAQRAVQGDLPDIGLSEKGKKNLENLPHTVIQVQPSSGISSSQFKCDGREHCSQMGSYDEALYFIKNCPGTQMDGNHDGIPCERQFKAEISKRHLFR